MAKGLFTTETQSHGEGQLQIGPWFIGDAVVNSYLVRRCSARLAGASTGQLALTNATAYTSPMTRKSGGQTHLAPPLLPASARQICSKCPAK